MLPSAGLSARPGAINPSLMDHVYGPCPPAAARVNAYGWPMAPGARVGPFVMARPETMVKEYCVEAVLPAPSVIRTVNVKLPLVPGVPLITPVPGFNDNPPGREPELTSHRKGA